MWQWTTADLTSYFERKVLQEYSDGVCFVCMCVQQQWRCSLIRHTLYQQGSVNLWPILSGVHVAPTNRRCPLSVPSMPVTFSLLAPLFLLVHCSKLQRTCPATEGANTESTHTHSLTNWFEINFHCLCLFPQLIICVQLSVQFFTVFVD